jgi:predicted TIM-barrel fold metal-dependent hydrolase
MPSGATDCHMHVFGPAERYPWAARRLYTPPDATLPQYLAMSGQTGLERVVLVQPSVYGTDNRALLDAMRQLGPERCRGVAVIGARTSQPELEELALAGVRGARLSITGRGADVAGARAAVLALADRLAPLGWHLQLIAKAAMIDALAGDLARLPVPLVIDHMGLPFSRLGVTQDGFVALLGLLRAGRCWVKLSAPYRVVGDGEAPAGASPFARGLAEANPERVVWGTDWPHPGHHHGGETPVPGYFEDFDVGVLLDWLRDACGTEAALHAALVTNPARLYGFPGGCAERRPTSAAAIS